MNPTQPFLSADTNNTGPISYRAVHTKNAWRKVQSHRTLASAISGKDGAAGLFTGKVRIDYEKHGDPLYVLVWQAGASVGYVIRPDSATNGIRVVEAPISDVVNFDENGGVSCEELAKYF